MHIVIGFLTAVASLLYALERLGVDIGWINPWAWKRKRKWLKAYNANPAFSISSPLEAVALLLTAVAKLDGDMSSDEKSELLNVFMSKLHQTNDEASSLLGSSVFLLSKNDEVFSHPEKVLTSCLPEFNESQKSSTIEMLTRIANIAGSPTGPQKAFIENVKKGLYPSLEKKDGWS